MDAILLVGGQGTRLRPLTAARHKSLVPVLNRPMIEGTFEWLRASGFERAVLALGQDNDDLARAYPDGDYGGLRLVTVRERSRLESGGAIRHAVQQAGVESRFTVLNGDVYVAFDFARTLAAHTASGADLTMALSEVSEPSSFGVAAIDDKGYITGFVEKPPPGTEPSNVVNAGVWIFEPGLVAEIPPGPVRVEETLFPTLVARGRRVLGYCFQETWADLGTPARYLQLNRALLPGGRIALAPDARVAPSAHIKTASIGAAGVVAEGAEVRDSILWESVHVGASARVVNSILADGVTIGPGAVVEGSVIGHHANVAAHARVPAGTSIEPGASYHEFNDR